ncbi:DUF397 domain-containing protein [Streptomyces sp. NPDC048442]|uniref:DUF397 domain-containing protein n=1 Tax=Streptomyces sp. NPDC048442 TaxID=3154823 RepID=UPI003428467A
MTRSTEPSWQKSSYSNGTGGECVEVARVSAHTAVRDSKMPEGHRIDLRHATWVEFIRAIQDGEMR